MSSAAFAVTTRSGLRGLRHFPLMFASSMVIRRQLRRTPGCVRFASIIAGPREFWTITVWENRDKMLDFMRSGAHDAIMWQFGHWLDSFWLARWQPTQSELGRWSGGCLAPEEDRRRTPRRTREQQAALEAALKAVPRLKDAVGDAGAPTYETSPAARRQRRAVAGAGGLMVRVAARHPLGAPAARRMLYRVARDLRAEPDVLRIATGVSGLREWYALAVVRDAQATQECLDGPVAARLSDAPPRVETWAMQWEPANEFGHWDGLRLRRERLGTAVPVPVHAMRAARPE